MIAFAMTEPDAGADVSGMATRARRDGGEWILDGKKHLITNAGLADVYTVFAVTDPEAGSRGLSCFLVEAGRPGFVFAGPQILSEPHPLGEIAFEAEDPTTAHAVLSECLDLCHELGVMDLTFGVVLLLGRLALEGADHTTARQRFAEAETAYAARGVSTDAPFRDLQAARLDLALKSGRDPRRDARNVNRSRRHGVRRPRTARRRPCRRRCTW